MEYPKPVMRMKELKKMGFGETFLRYVILNQGNRGIAWQDDPSYENSPYNFDTEALEKFRKAQCTGR